MFVFFVSFRSYLRSPSGGGVICFSVFLAFVALFCSALCINLYRRKKNELDRIFREKHIDDENKKSSEAIERDIGAAINLLIVTVHN